VGSRPGIAFRIQNQNSGEVLEVSGLSTADGAQMGQWADLGLADQR
jgi:hypothetical protein